MSTGFTAFDCVSLIVYTVFIFWEPYRVGNKDISFYEEKVVSLQRFQLPTTVFGPVWFAIKGMLTASIFLFFKWCADPDVWTFQGVYGLFFGMVVLSKMWTPLFFKWKMFGSAAFLAFLLMGSSITMVVFMGISPTQANVGYLWPLPLSLAIPYALWLTIATMIAFEWYRMSNGYQMGGGGLFSMSWSVPSLPMHYHRCQDCEVDFTNKTEYEIHRKNTHLKKSSVTTFQTHKTPSARKPAD